MSSKSDINHKDKGNIKLKFSKSYTNCGGDTDGLDFRIARTSYDFNQLSII